MRNTKGSKNHAFGKPLSEEHKHKISEAKKGKPSSYGMLGKHHSEEAKVRIRARLSEIRKGSGNPMFGRHASAETRRKMSEAQRGEKHYLFGKHHSEETRRKLSEANKGKVLSAETRHKIGEASHRRKQSEATKRKLSESRKGSGNPNFGKHPSLETRKKIGIASRGEKNYNWKGGITPLFIKIRSSIEYGLWRSAVYARDSFTCQKCGDATGGNLVAHHILNFSDHEELRFAIDNGVTFCKDCHNKFHKIYGNRNNTREQLEEFLKS